MQKKLPIEPMSCNLNSETFYETKNLSQVTSLPLDSFGHCSPKTPKMRATWKNLRTQEKGARLSMKPKTCPIVTSLPLYNFRHFSSDTKNEGHLKKSHNPRKRGSNAMREKIKKRVSINLTQWIVYMAADTYMHE